MWLPYSSYPLEANGYWTNLGYSTFIQPLEFTCFFLVRTRPLNINLHILTRYFMDQIYMAYYLGTVDCIYNDKESILYRRIRFPYGIHLSFFKMQPCRIFKYDCTPFFFFSSRSFWIFDSLLNLLLDCTLKVSRRLRSIIKKSVCYNYCNSRGYLEIVLNRKEGLKTLFLKSTIYWK